MDRDGNKTGGRQKGTPNKTTAKVRGAISDLLDFYMNGNPEDKRPEGANVNGKFLEDFGKLKAKDRVYIAKELAVFVVPKMQSVALDAKVDEKRKSNTERIVQLSQVPDQPK